MIIYKLLDHKAVQWGFGTSLKRNRPGPESVIKEADIDVLTFFLYTTEIIPILLASSGKSNQILVLL